MLTTASTASAAELLINNLRPYLNVVQIGAKTMGKDMASFAIADFRTPKPINMVLHPLVFKLYNARDIGDYGSGLTPDYPVDEFTVLPLVPFGDPSDPMLKKALELVGVYPMVAAKSKSARPSDSMYKSDQRLIDRRESLPIVTKKDKWGIDINVK